MKFALLILIAIGIGLILESGVAMGWIDPYKS